MAQRQSWGIEAHGLQGMYPFLEGKRGSVDRGWILWKGAYVVSGIRR
jgi:hypothetical protein